MSVIDTSVQLAGLVCPYASLSTGVTRQDRHGWIVPTTGPLRSDGSLRLLWLYRGGGVYRVSRQQARPAARPRAGLEETLPAAGPPGSLHSSDFLETLSAARLPGSLSGARLS